MIPAEDTNQPVMVELIMLVSRGEDNRLSGTVRPGNGAEALGFSGTLELMRVFEELVPAAAQRPSAPPATRGER